MRWHTPDYWDRQWRTETGQSVYEQRQKTFDRVDWWNRRAPGFASRNHERGDSSSLNTNLDLICRSGFLTPDTEILDIGCGPGNYALPLAGQVKRVVALDASPVMLKILAERAASMGITNIETVCIPWEDVDLDKMGWRGRFGLVAAIKSPGIRDSETLEKLVAASGKGCFYNGFIRREDNAQSDIWRILFKEEKPPVTADAFNVFHLLHAWGYLPSLQLSQSTSEKTGSVEETEQELTLLMQPYEDLFGNMDEQIRSYVRHKAEDNQFTRTRYSVEGHILFSVSDRQEIMPASGRKPVRIV